MEAKTEQEFAAEGSRLAEEKFGGGPWVSLTRVITAPKQEEPDAPSGAAGPESASGSGVLRPSTGRRMRTVVIVGEICSS